MANLKSPDDLWSPFKYLQSVTESILNNSAGSTGVYYLETLFRNHKQNFCSLLRNPPKNEKCREEIRRGITDGVTLPGLGHTILSKDLVDESIIISDMYNLNEYIALQLLCTAQQQMPQHPGLPRGLVAVLLYYDGRKAIVSTLKDLFQARSGISWCTETSQEVTQLVTNFTDQLANDGVLSKIVDLLEELDFTQELEVLTANRALGPPKHYRQVLDLFEEIRLLLAMCLFNWSAQCGLSKTVTLKLIDFLAKYSPNDSRGGIDNVTLTLMMALLYALDVSVLQKREDGEESVKNLPIISDTSFIETIIDKLDSSWECDGLRSMALFSLAVSLATLRLAPQNLQPIQIFDQDETLADAAIQGKVFDFIQHIFLENDLCFEQEFMVRRVHALLTDFIEFMHSKVTELRAKADETARTVQCYQQQNIEPPSTICRNFELLLLTVGKLYSKDKLNLNLCLEYWGPMEIPTNYQRNSSRSVSLFKFIRLAGELLPPLLFVPYLKMLAGLSSCQQAAQNAFNLLKQGSGVSGSTTLTWDHFFSSLAQYYTNLRVDQYPNSDTVYRNLNRNISPQEIAGLHAVLGVIKAVAENDEVARIAICDQPSWAPIQIMLGLVSCSVPIAFKADLLMTLASLAKSKRTATLVWNSLEASQIINTIPSINKYQQVGIESELEQNEIRNEIYPLTQGILELLYSLISTAEPSNLGSGARKPGLLPYLEFLLNSIFLKFYNRNYKDVQEKWKIGEKCLRILKHFMKNYEPNPRDFMPHEDNVPCGFNIMLKLNAESAELKLILNLIDEACIRLDTYTSFTGKKELEESVLHCLQILERALSIQDLFFDAHFTANCSILLAGLNKLLLGVNSRTGRPDHMLNITKFVTYKSWLPNHTLSAVKVLTFVTRQPNINSQLLGVFTSTERMKNEIRHGFVESLEGESSSDEESVDVEIKMAIIRLLQECLPQSAPNLTHYLLGFDITKDIRKTCLQQPGVMDFPSTCIKSLVTLLDNYLEKVKTNQEILKSEEKLIESSYGLLYSLCFNTKTSEVILRFLRSCNDFFGRHLSLLPFSEKPGPRVLSQMTGLLKCVAIELKQVAAHNHVSQFGNLCKNLLGVAQGTGRDTNRRDGTLQTRNMALELSYFNSQEQGETEGQFFRKTSDSEGVLLLAQLLNCVEFETRLIDRPKWELFDNSTMANLFQSCEVVKREGKLIDIKKLSDTLRQDLANVQCAMPVGQMISQEIESVLMYALQINKQRCETSATAKFLEAWGQVTEIVFSVAPGSSLTNEMKQNLILDILQIVLKKVVPVEMMLEYANLVSSTVLLLLVNLRLCYIQGSDSKANDSTLDHTMARSTLKSTNSLNLKFILKNIVEWIIQSGVGSQKLRINLYASLLNAMHIIRQNSDQDSSLSSSRTMENYVSRLDRTLVEAKRDSSKNSDLNQMQIIVEIFAEFGDKLIDILCHDSIGGHDVCRMLALSCMDMLLNLDSMISFMEFISKRGYLSHLIDSLQKSDRQLSTILESQPDNLKALYVYESKMAMLSRVGSNYIGAELLLEHRILAVLSTMRCYDLHPDFQMRNQYSGVQISSFIPSVETLYQQILFPALNLCDVLLTTLGQDNQSAITQVVHFLLSHGDMIEIVLRAGSPLLKTGLLKELSSLTGLIARTANQQLLMYAEPNSNQDLGAHLYRLQKLMMSLFPRFILKDSTIQEIRKEELSSGSAGGEKSKNMILILQITSNLVMYARNVISNHSADHRVISVLFSPSLAEGIQRHDRIGVGSTSEVSPNLGIVISQLKAVVKFYNEEKVAHDSLVRQINSLQTVHLDLNAQNQQKSLSESIKNKSAELKMATFVAEHCLYLLWAHLDYYMLRAIPVDPLKFNKNYTNLNTENVLLISSSEAGWRAIAEDVVVLKKHLIGVFNETFCNQLITTTQEQSATEKSYMEALLRRIKRLIQFVPVN